QPILERLIGKPLGVSWGDWRPGDQKVYVSDIRKASRDLKWAPKVSVKEGIEKLFRWVQQGVKPS
ncbi:MAG TPA: hypothetical protein PLI60_04715, partial [Anaerolineaceae bacterium]|nr:hypothetical protein [Anaerolineaceae bacterium]